MYYIINDIYEFITIYLTILILNHCILYIKFKYFNKPNNKKKISIILNNLIYTKELLNIEINNINIEIDILLLNENESERDKRLFRRNLMNLYTNYMNLKDKLDTISYIIQELDDFIIE